VEIVAGANHLSSVAQVSVEAVTPRRGAGDQRARTSREGSGGSDPRPR
jgi:hypothetical protein